MGNSDTSEGADEDACDREFHALTKNHLENLSLSGANCDPHSNLTSPALDGISNQSVESHECKDQSQQAHRGSRAHDQELRTGSGTLIKVGKRPQAENRLVHIEPANQLPQRC